jgi:glyoxylase-like metal-dependent hydrolase (beta-lactamase superfamily II)
MRTLTAKLLTIAAFVAMAGFASAQSTDTDVHTLKVRDNVYMLVGAGGNITVQVGRDGVFVVDAGLAQMSDKVLAAIKKISDLPIRYVVDTHFHPDHVGGNEALRKAGATIAGGNVAGDLGAEASRGAQIISHENVLNRMSAPTGKQAPTPQGGWPTDTFFDEEKKLYVNGEGIEIIHLPTAHTDGDSIVFFRRSDVISTGDLFTTTMYPLIDIEHGGSIQGFIAALNRILDLTITVYGQEGGTLIIPGHGRLCDQGDLLNYREMATIIRDRIQDMVKKGMTLAQVKAAKPTFDYDPLYGSNTFWTGDMFVEAVYKSLTQSK